MNPLLTRSGDAHDQQHRSTLGSNHGDIERLRRGPAVHHRDRHRESRIVHQLTAEMRTAVRLFVQDNLSIAEAAGLAGLSDDVVCDELRDNLAVRAFWDAQVKLLIDRAKPRALHVLVKEGVPAPTLRLAWRRP